MRPWRSAGAQTVLPPRSQRYASGRHVVAAVTSASSPTAGPFVTTIGTWVRTMSGIDRRTARRNVAVRRRCANANPRHTSSSASPWNSSTVTSTTGQFDRNERHADRLRPGQEAQEERAAHGPGDHERAPDRPPEAERGGILGHGTPRARCPRKSAQLDAAKATDAETSVGGDVTSRSSRSHAATNVARKARRAAQGEGRRGTPARTARPGRSRPCAVGGRRAAVRTPPRWPPPAAS